MYDFATLSLFLLHYEQLSTSSERNAENKFKKKEPFSDYHCSEL